ncbi:MAG: hydroxymyristoyl-ACP dehydratase [Bacteroidales bacterium]
MGVFEKALIRGEEILDYIPQRDPIVMVDAFFGIHKAHSYSALTVNDENVFCEDDRLVEGGVIEHIAQSAALRVGYEHVSTGQAVPVGFIGSVNKLNLYDLPRKGDRLQTTLTVEAEMMGITLVSATVAVGSKVIAEGQMKIALQREE